jgi:hypothetical protein
MLLAEILRHLYTKGKQARRWNTWKKRLGSKQRSLEKLCLSMYDDKNLLQLQGLPPFYGEPRSAAKAAWKRAKDKLLSKEVIHDFILCLKEVSRFHRVD